MRHLAAVAIVTTACVGVSDRITFANLAPVGTQDAREWSVTLHMSGGFAGVRRTLQVSSAGELSARDLRRTSAATARATSEELAQIASLVANPPQRASRALPSGCNDCFQYAVDVDIKGRQSSMTFDDVTLQGSEAEPVVRLLTTILNRLLNAQTQQP